MTLDALAAEEQELRFPAFTNAMAWELGSWLVERSRAAGWAPAIQITRLHHTLFSYAFEGTSLDNEAWLQRKARTVYRFGHSSLYMALLVESLQTTGTQRYRLDEADYTFGAGGLPLLLQGTGLVGVLALSDLPGDLDHTLGVEALRWLL